MAGVTLIELMVALAIGTLLILGLVQVFGASRTAYQLSEGMARTQENARFAMDYLQRDIRMAGHYGCVNDQAHLQTPGSLQPHFGAAPLFPLDFAVSVQGYEATGTAPGSSLALGGTWNAASGLPALITALNPRPGSDVIVLRYFSNEGAPVTAISNAASEETVTLADGRWDTLTGDGVATPTLFGIADCSRADVFAGSGAGTGIVTVTVASAATPDTDLAGRFTPQPSGQTTLYRAESLVYYVGTSTASGEPALFRARFNGTSYVPEELVEGIENLQLLYGQDRITNLATTPPSGYIDVQNPANAGGTWVADDWRRVGLVQVGILARSPGRAAAPQASVNPRSVLGVSFTAPTTNDGRYRASYEATVAMRNRLYGN
ncbi:type IV pilus assembly protein PilW [Luteimonas cucumeris]|uniref:Type IV pilus assembly protein PilW n=1 Tax=Luteimonas cucumeris TaxID=985012 RepID=A0A562KXV4_9GAMM|nr:PilW family protein [Luteimonas cucumeris]TWI00213.1 type IV pilus assembly protein PilW [Luteimonas cucumeris]